MGPIDFMHESCRLKNLSNDQSRCLLEKRAIALPEACQISKTQIFQRDKHRLFILKPAIALDKIVFILDEYIRG
jgi:hypothetical protein